MRNIGIVCACESELAPFLPHIENMEISQRAMHEFYTGTIGSQKVTAVECGVCKVNGALAAQLLISHFGVDAVINCGAAGGMDPKVQLLDTVISEKIANHDMEQNILTDQFPNMETPYFYGGEALLGAARACAKEKGGNGIWFGTMVSGEEFIEDHRREKINEDFAPLSVDMETAGIAQACYINGIPFLSVRTITDTAAHKGIENYRENNENACRIASDFVMDMLRKLLLKLL